MGQWTKMTCSKVIRVKCKGYGDASHTATKFIFMLLNFCAVLPLKKNKRTALDMHL